MKVNIFVFFYVLLIVSFQSIGYDMYSHSLIYYHNLEKITHSYSFFDNFIIIPRYALLSMIYEITRNMGIPTGWIATILMFLPTRAILTNLELINGLRNKFIVALFICTIAIYFYSGLTLVLMWIFAALVTKKSIYMVGAIFHPAGFILGGLTIFIKSNRIYNVIILIISIFILCALSYININFYELFPSVDVGNIKLKISFDDFFKLLQRVYETKSNEINVMLLIVCIVFFTGSKIYKAIKYISVTLRLFLFVQWLPMLLILLCINAVFRSNSSLFQALITIDISEIIYQTWFDFGGREYNLGFWSTNGSRYK
jgi:hypothetical protein